MKKSLKDWVLATRPWSFPASAMPVLVTVFVLLAQGEKVVWWLGLLAVLNIVLVHAAGNTWSDYFDYKRGVDRDDTYGTKILTSGQFTPKEVLRLSVGLLIAAVALGIVMVLLTGWTLLWIGLAGIALSLLYPPLKYGALGDVVIILCYSFLPMIGTSFIVSGEIQWNVFWYAIPVGLITVAILHINNTRDIETDGRAGIKTFSMITGRTAALRIYVAEVIVPYLWIVAGVVAGLFPWPTLLVLASLPIALKNVKSALMYKAEGLKSIALLDEKTAELQLAFSTLLILGLLATFLIP